MYKRQELDVSKFITDTDLKDSIYNSEVSCPDEETSKLMIDEIKSARKKKDTLGGSITCVATNFPPALVAAMYILIANLMQLFLRQ